MDSWLQTGLIVVLLVGATSAFIWLALRVGHTANKTAEDPNFNKVAEADIEHIFNDEFREELRNRGRLHFEKSDVREI